MKTFIAIVVASTLFGVAVLGYRTMIHGSDHIPTDCAATILGTRCGDGFAPLPDAASHIGTVKAYTLAVSIAAMVIAVAWFVVRRSWTRGAVMDLHRCLTRHRTLAPSKPI